MKLSRLACLACALSFAAALAGCSSDMNANNAANANASASPAASATPAVQTLTQVERPQKIKDMMQERGEEDQATPVLRIVEPLNGASLTGSTVSVKLALSGDLKGYKPHKDPATGMGNHIHVILDNQPYEAYYNLDEPFELRNVSEGLHTLRVFASRPWHESYKNDGSFQLVTFTVKGGVAPQPTPTANPNAPSTATREGKDMQPSTGESVDRTKPLLTYSRPKGEYKGDDTNAIMIDFWLTGAKLQGDGGEYRVRYTVDGGEAKYIDKWEPIWLAGWTAGKHTVKLELVDRNGNAVDNGGYNTTTREITVTK
jgi:hypothetical protein